MAFTYGRDADDVVVNPAGALIASTTLTVYASEADAKSGSNALASVPVSAGRWSYTSDLNRIWVTVPGGGDPWLIQSQFGEKGDPGPANTLAIGTVETGAAVAAATITGNAPNQTLNLSIPKGDPGEDGHSPVVAMEGDQLVIDGAIVGPHLTGPPGDIGAQDSAIAQHVQSGPLTKAALDSTYARVEGRPINAYDHGVRSDVADITKPLNDLITANPGATITLAPGSYTASADNGGVTSYDRGIKIDRPGTTLDLRGTTMTVLPNGAGNYQLITTTAPDCRIIGGVLIGDVTTHKATDGEWGHGIVATTGGDRLLVDGTYITQMWGDGVFMDGGAADVCLRSVIADGNRRQGCSITNNVRPRIEGGAYINTGIHGFVAPGAGIDIEPDPNMGHSVTDFVIIEPLLAGNMGSGLMVCEAPGATTTGSAIVRSSGNQGHGVITDRMGPGELYSVTIQADCARNGGSGFMNNVPGTRLKGCIATGNAGRGFVINARSTLISPLAEENGMNGYYFDQGASGSFVMSIASNSNGRAQNDTYPDVDIWAPNLTVTTGTSVAAESGNKASFGWVVRPSAANANLVGCSTSGTFPQGAYLDLGPSTRAVPTPGA